MLNETTTIMYIINPTITFFLTVISGIIILVLGQIFIKLILTPIQYQKELIGEIDASLSYYANIYTQRVNDPDLYDEAKKVFRQNATKLGSNTKTVPYYKFFSEIGIVVPLRDINESEGLLYGILNTMSPNMTDDDIKEIVDWVSQIKIKLKLNNN